MAGGTDLLVQMRGGRAKPQTVIDIKRIPGMMDIRAEGGGFVIGAAVSGAVLGEHAALRKAWPGVVEAANLIGSTQVQGRASLGGNLCNASPAADSVPALIAAAAVCIVEGSSGRREIPVEKVQIWPGQDVFGCRRNSGGFPPAAKAGEIGRRLPAPDPAHGDGYCRGRARA